MHSLKPHARISMLRRFSGGPIDEANQTFVSSHLCWGPAILWPNLSPINPWSLRLFPDAASLKGPFGKKKKLRTQILTKASFLWKKTSLHGFPLITGSSKVFKIRSVHIINWYPFKFYAVYMHMSTYVLYWIYRAWDPNSKIMKGSLATELSPDDSHPTDNYDVSSHCPRLCRPHHSQGVGLIII